MLDRFRLTDRVAVVTGGGSGLGKEIAVSLAEAGASVALVGRTARSLEEVAAEIGETNGVRTLVVPGDVASPDVCETVVRRCVDELGGLDIVVNNAGINVRGSIEEVTPDDFDRVIATNVRGPWLMCRSAAPVFRERKFGRVINVASSLGLVARDDRSLYCTSKGAVVQLTRQLAIEWARIGDVTVNALCPGPFETEMNRTLVEDPEQRAVFAAYTAMDRWGRLEEIGPAAVFLASPAASYITGALLPIDGGWVAK